MSKAIIGGAAALALALAATGLGYWVGSAQYAEAAASENSRSTGRAAIETIVRDYLIANPEVMVEVQAALEQKQELAQRSRQIDTIKTASADIFDAAHDGILGNPQGATTLVEFFDYNCGFCKRAVADMEALVASDPDLRVVMKEFPILGPESREAHVVSMAFRALMPERWAEFHEKLISAPGRSNEKSAVAVAVSLGADEEALRSEMKNPEIASAFDHTYDLANKLSISGTPSYVVGTEVVFGALGKAVLEEKVALARACEGGAC